MPSIGALAPLAFNSTTLYPKALAYLKLENGKLIRKLRSYGPWGRGVWKTHVSPVWGMLENANVRTEILNATKNTKSAGDNAAIALYWGHDANIAVSINGRVQCSLSLERIFKVRYYSGSLQANTALDWSKALSFIRDRCECETENKTCPRHFHHGVIVAYGSERKLWRLLPHLVERKFTVEQWHLVNHHDAHASLGFYGSAFHSALVVSYDAWGNDGAFNVYLGQGNQIKRVAQLNYKFGNAYRHLAGFLPAISDIGNDWFCEAMKGGKETDWVDINVLQQKYTSWTWAGKLMGYAGTAKPDPELRKWVNIFFDEHTWILKNFSVHRSDRVPRKLLRIACGPEEGHRVLAATIQAEFENIVYDIIRNILNDSNAKQSIQGIVLTGGCALNVLVNQRVYDTLLEGDSGYLRDLYVPPAPNDEGLAVGGLWKVFPPVEKQPLQYLGFRLWDEESLEYHAYERNATSLAALGGVEYLAELLAGGPAWSLQSHRKTVKPIIAVVRGRQEFGPRALGHRSLLAVPDSDSMRDRMNRLKHRKWYRPVAPMIAEEALESVFGRKVYSPYMSMAPRVLDDVRAVFPALAHADGTARHQSVRRSDEPWIHSLLLAVGRLTGLAALINTSFNSKGLPIVNEVSECLEMLDQLPELDYVLINDWLFQAAPKNFTEVNSTDIPLTLQILPLNSP